MEPIVIFIIILSIIAVVGIGLLVLFELQYSNIVNNPGKLCLSGSCEAPSEKCGSTPFKLNVSGPPTCAPSSIFADKIPNTAI
jgi:hypothetical protein